MFDRIARATEIMVRGGVASSMATAGGLQGEADDQLPESADSLAIMTARARERLAADMHAQGVKLGARLGGLSDSTAARSFMAKWTSELEDFIACGGVRLAPPKRDGEKRSQTTGKRKQNAASAQPSKPKARKKQPLASSQGTAS